MTHYHHKRPHQGIGNVPVVRKPRIWKLPSGRVRCRTRRGGLLKHFYRAA